MAAPVRPRLRPFSARRVSFEPPMVALEDPRRFSPSPIILPEDVFRHVIPHLDGRNTVEDVQRLVHAESGRHIDLSGLQRLVAQLDQALAFEGETFDAAVRRYLDAPERPAALAGRSYPSEASRLADELARIFRGRGASGAPALAAPGRSGAVRDGGPRLRAVVSPHIDFGRGGATYTWAYRSLVEQSDADVFIVLGVAHQACRSRFVLTRKDFATPFGPVKTDAGLVDALAEHVGGDPFRDELAHRTEHSIEFQVVFLKHVLRDRPFTIVPILVGSFHDFIERRIDPIEDPGVARFIEGLRAVERSSGRRVAYIGGVDLCHVGPEFGDPAPVDSGVLKRIRAYDRAMLERAEAVDPAGWFRTAAEVDDRWRVCGLAATFTMLHAIGPARGRVLRYDQAVDGSGACCVSFASMVFHEVPATGGG